MYDRTGFKGESYIKVMDWVAEKAAQTLAQTGRSTVVVQDNGSLHTSLLVRQQWERWQKQGLYIFFLPPYCSQMNPIETQWYQLKSHELGGQIFDNEYDARDCGNGWDESCVAKWVDTHWSVLYLTLFCHSGGDRIKMHSLNPRGGIWLRHAKHNQPLNSLMTTVKATETYFQK